MLGVRKGRRLRRRRKKNVFKTVAKELYVAIASEHDEQGQITRVIITDFTGSVMLDYPLDHFDHSMEDLREKVVPHLINKDKVVVGYRLNETIFRSLRIQHPWMNTRDVATFSPLMEERFDALSRMLVPCSVENLASKLLNTKIRTTIEKCKALMSLYQKVRNDWEDEISVLLQQQDRQRQLVQSKRLEEYTVTTGDCTGADESQNDSDELDVNIAAIERCSHPVDSYDDWLSEEDECEESSAFHLPPGLLQEVS